MSDDLVRGLRGEFLKCNCAAFSRSECCCDTVWPESLCREAANAIERKDAALRVALEALDEVQTMLSWALLDGLDEAIPTTEKEEYRRACNATEVSRDAIAKIKEALND